MRDTRLSTLVVNAQADAFAKLADGGFIDIYDGERPKSADDPVTKQRLGVSIQLGSPAFQRAVNGEVSANPMTMGISVAELEKATWARVTMADHKTVLQDVSVGMRRKNSPGNEPVANLILPNTHIVENIPVSCSSFVHSVAKSTPGS